MDEHIPIFNILGMKELGIKKHWPFNLALSGMSCSLSLISHWYELHVNEYADPSKNTQQKWRPAVLCIPNMEHVHYPNNSQQTHSFTGGSDFRPTDEDPSDWYPAVVADKRIIEQSHYQDQRNTLTMCQDVMASKQLI